MKSRDMRTKSAVFLQGLKKKKTTQDMCLVQDFVHDWSSQGTSQFSQVAFKYVLPCVWDCGKESIRVNLDLSGKEFRVALFKQKKRLHICFPLTVKNVFFTF